ncbi:V-type ATPase subunit family protein, partial [Teladorsagia circumcincta]
ANFEKLEEELISINKSTKQLKKNHVQLLEMKAVLEKVQSLLDESKRDAAMSISEAVRGEAGPFTIGVKNDFDKERRDETELKFVTGVINRNKVISFERFIWRFCRGKVFVRTADITEKTEVFDHDKDDDKAVFILFFSGDQLRSRVHKICVGFHATIYNCPENQNERAHLLAQINGQVGDMQSVIGKTLEYRHKIVFAAALSVKKWTFMLLKLKSIFHTLNMFSVDVTHKCLIAECWVPTVDLHLVNAALRKGTNGRYAWATLKYRSSLTERERRAQDEIYFKLTMEIMETHNRSVVDVLFVFIPQVFFLFCIFVYLCVMVVMKWIFFYVKPAFIFGRLYPGPFCAPSLLIGLINMFMLKARDPGFVQNIGSVNATDSVVIDGKNYTYTMYDQCYLQQWYPGQVLTEQVLLLLAVVSIPIMLLVKPFYVRSLAKRGLPIPGGHGHADDEDEEFNFGDVMVYQAIHTIEFALGCISHTASYLRLWALSLAHAQLSEVLWDMLLSIGLNMGGWAGSAAIFILYYLFGTLSISILILMEGLSAFLHALRLHWALDENTRRRRSGKAQEQTDQHRKLARCVQPAV